MVISFIENTLFANKISRVQLRHFSIYASTLLIFQKGHPKMNKQTTSFWSFYPRFFPFWNPTYRKQPNICDHILAFNFFWKCDPILYRNSGHAQRHSGHAQRNNGYRGTVDTEEQWTQRNSGHRETVSTERQWTQGNSGHRGTVDTEEQWTQRNSGHRGTVDTERRWAQRDSGHRGTVDTEEQRAKRNSEHRGTVDTQSFFLLLLHIHHIYNREMYQEIVHSTRLNSSSQETKAFCCLLR